MFRFVLSIFFALTGLVTYLLYLHIYVKLHNMILNRKINIFKGNYIIIQCSDFGENNVLRQKNNQNDIVFGMTENIMGWFIVTDKGFYIFYRFICKVRFFENIEDQNNKIKKYFSKIYVYEENLLK